MSLRVPRRQGTLDGPNHCSNDAMLTSEACRYGYESQGVGVYGLMCAGEILDERPPTHVCAYLKYRAGWAGTINHETCEDKGPGALLHHQDERSSQVP
jgi:hypothetical protein